MPTEAHCGPRAATEAAHPTPAPVESKRSQTGPDGTHIEKARTQASTSTTAATTHTHTHTHTPQANRRRHSNQIRHTEMCQAAFQRPQGKQNTAGPPEARHWGSRGPPMVQQSCNRGPAEANHKPYRSLRGARLALTTPTETGAVQGHSPSAAFKISKDTWKPSFSNNTPATKAGTILRRPLASPAQLSRHKRTGPTELQL